MNISDLKSAVPDYTKNLRLNLESVLSEKRRARPGRPAHSGDRTGQRDCCALLPLSAALEAGAAEQVAPAQAA